VSDLKKSEIGVRIMQVELTFTPWILAWKESSAWHRTASPIIKREKRGGVIAKRAKTRKTQREQASWGVDFKVDSVAL
jgi:hypothetical protein